MPPKTKDGRTTGETLGNLIITFGAAMADALDDPKVREKAKDLSQAVVDAAAKAWGDRMKDEEAKKKVRVVGKVARDFGRSLEDHFKAEEPEKPESTEPAA